MHEHRNFFVIFIAILLLFACGRSSVDVESYKTTLSIASDPSWEIMSGGDEVLFISTQLNPVPEARRFREIILSGFPSSVRFQPNNDSIVYEQIAHDIVQNPSRPIIFGGLQPEFVNLAERSGISPMEEFWEKLSKSRDFLPDAVDFARSEDGDLLCVPWMRATYLMIAHKSALRYLPKEADLDRLSYQDFLRWGENLEKAYRTPKLGFPFGDRGLMHRFFQGYLYPSFTGHYAKNINSDAALSMWMFFREIWKTTSSKSLVANNVSSYLLTGDFLVGWDHAARLLPALMEEPENFVVFPAPSGPMGRGYMDVAVGVTVPVGITNREPALNLIDYLTHPKVQAMIPQTTGFLPVVEIPQGLNISPIIRDLVESAALQTLLPDAIRTPLPAGMGEIGGELNSIYIYTFSQIILEGMDIRETLNFAGERINEILRAAGRLE